MDPNNFVIFAGTLVEEPRTLTAETIRMRVERPGRTAPTRILVQVTRLDEQVRERLAAGTEVQVVGSLELCTWQDASGVTKELLRINADQVIIIGGEQDPRRLTFSGLDQEGTAA